MAGSEKIRGARRRRMASFGAVVCTVVACMGATACSDDSTSSPTETADVEAPESVVVDTPQPEATIDARQRYFGLDNVDPETGAVRPDRVLLSWAGNTTFAASIGGHVVLLDAYVNRFEVAMARSGTTPAELAAVAPEVVFLGHGHSDHMGDLPTVVQANPGVKIVGLGEHCTDLEVALRGADYTCVGIIPAPSAQAQMATDDQILPGVEVTAVRHPHNGEVAATYPDPADTQPAFPSKECVFPPEDPADPPARSLDTSQSAAVFYLLTFGEFSLAFQNTVGANDASGVTAVYEALPSPDVLVTPVVGLFRKEILDPVAALRPKVVVPNHHDLPCAGPMKAPFEEQLATLPADQRPVLWYISDPGDYLRPLSWDPAAPVWSDEEASAG